MKHPLLFVFLLICSVACRSGLDQKKPLIEELVVPSEYKSHLPFLHTSKEGQTYLSWVEEVGDTAQMKFSKLEASAWSAPKNIAQGTNWFVNWADFPSMVAEGNFLTAHWLQKRAAGTYDYDIYVTQSHDGGASWNPPFILHKDGVAAEHGFVTLLPAEKGKFFATWLDGRHTKTSGHANHEVSGEGAMTLRAAWINAEGKTTEEWELDKRTCDCCQTAAFMASEGPIVVYRDRSPHEVRDIYTTQFQDSQWSTPQPVHQDLWEIPGCPVNGPAMAGNEKGVAVAWFTAANQISKVQWAFRANGEEDFSIASVLAEANTTGRVDIIALKNEQFGVSWMETQGELAVIQWARLNTRGDILQKIKVAETSSARASGFPVMTQSLDGVLMAWTELIGEEPKVQSAWIRY